MHVSNLRSLLLLGAAAVLLLFPLRAGATNGHVLHGVGSVSQALGGVGIATSQDAIGANTSNVGSIPFLESSSIGFGAELFVPDRNMYGSFSGIGQGTVDSRSREAVIPSFGIVYKVDDDLAVGFTGVGVGGFGVDYPANSFNPSGGFNPLALPQPLGFGAIYSDYQLLQVTPSIAYKVTPRLSLGIGADVDWAKLSVNPWPATPPNKSGYPTGTHSASAWGAGFTVGAVYKPAESVALGVSLKSPQWFNSFHWNSQYPDGAPASFGFRLDYPLIAGAGAAWRPTERWLIGTDVKWINYSDTKGFDKKNFAATPSGPYVQGFGWQDIWTLGIGVQYKVVPRVPLRIGYNYGGNPIPANQQFFNVFAPAVVQHHLTAGLGVELGRGVEVDVAYYHAFQNSASGPFISNGGAGYPPINQAIPGTKVTNTLSEDSVSLEVAVKF